MNYGAMTSRQPSNPGMTGSSPYDFRGYTGGVGSNQYQDLPPWMNTRMAQPGGTNVGRPGGTMGAQDAPNFNFQPIGGWQASPATNPFTNTQNPTQAQINANLPPGWMLPTSSPGGMPIIPYNPNQFAPEHMRMPQYMGSFAAGGNIGPVYGGSPVLGSGSPIPAGQTGIPGGTIGPGYYSPGGAGYGVAVPPSPGAGVPAPSGPYYSGAGGGPFVGGGPFTYEQTIDPALTSQMAQLFQSQVGKGVPPFNLPTQLPFGLGMTKPGQLTAPTDPINQALHNFYMGQQTNIPGASALATIANQGISALPEWQATVAAEGQNIAQTEAQLREQSAYGGGTAGSPMAASLSNYLQGATAQQNAMLAQMQQQNILQGQIPVAEGLLSGAQGFGQYAQGLEQQSIQNQYNEFLRTQPQNNPYLQYMYGMATSWDPALTRPVGGSTLAGILSSLPNFNVGGTAQTAATAAAAA